MPKAAATVDEYIQSKPNSVQEILNKLRALVAKILPKATLEMKWGAPVFRNQHDEPVIYLYGGRDHANLGFVRGAELADPEKKLVGTGKSGRHIKVFPVDPFPEKMLKNFVRQCDDQT